MRKLQQGEKPPVVQLAEDQLTQISNALQDEYPYDTLKKRKHKKGGKKKKEKKGKKRKEKRREEKDEWNDPVVGCGKRREVDREDHQAVKRKKGNTGNGKLRYKKRVFFLFLFFVWPRINWGSQEEKFLDIVPACDEWEHDRKEREGGRVWVNGVSVSDEVA